MIDMHSHPGDILTPGNFRWIHKNGIFLIKGIKLHAS